MTLSAAPGGPWGGPGASLVLRRECVEIWFGKTPSADMGRPRAAMERKPSGTMAEGPRAVVILLAETP